MKQILLVLSVLASCNSAFAGDTSAAGSSAPAGAAAGRLPSCVDSPADVKSILETESNNLKSSHKYDGFRKAVSSDTDEQLVARLVYSEALAANCPKSTAQMMPGIAAVIAHRIKIDKSARQSVFRLQQFASSLNNYPESRYADFLCPKDEKLWSAAVAAANKALNGDDSLPPTMDHYYFFHHFKVPHPAPAWTKAPDDKFPGSSDYSSCLKFYSLGYKAL